MHVLSYVAWFLCRLPPNEYVLCCFGYGLISECFQPQMWASADIVESMVAIDRLKSREENIAVLSLEVVIE